MRANNQVIERLCVDCMMSIKYSLDAFAKEDENKKIVEESMKDILPNWLTLKVGKQELIEPYG